MSALAFKSRALLWIGVFTIASCVVSTTPPLFSGSVPTCAANQGMFDSTMDRLSVSFGLSKADHEGVTNSQGDQSRAIAFYRDNKKELAVVGFFNGHSFNFQLYEESFESPVQFQRYKSRLQAELEVLALVCKPGTAVE